MIGNLRQHIDQRRPLILTVVLAGAFYWLVYMPFLQTGGMDPTYLVEDFHVVPEELDSPQVQADERYIPHTGSYQWSKCSEPCFFAARIFGSSGTGTTFRSTTGQEFSTTYSCLTLSTFQYLISTTSGLVKTKNWSVN